jgi:dihydrofolate reductase
MPKVRVHNFSISLDGYGAGPDQSLDVPLGVGGEQLHDWVVVTAAFKRMHDPGREVAEGDAVDERFAARNNVGVGATIMGRNMFGPVRGSWGDSDWRGWWGDDPPYHHPTYVLTHHPHDPIEMEGGTTFHFVTDGPEAALEQAIAAAGAQDVQIGGGAATIQQYLRAGLIDELHVAIVPRLLGAGERLFDGLDGAIGGYEVVEFAASPGAAHAGVTATPPRRGGRGRPPRPRSPTTG